MTDLAAPATFDFLTADSSAARIIRAAISAIAELGIDHVTASHLIESAQVARSTMYSYFGDATGVFAELWRAAGPTWWAELVAGRDNPLAHIPGLSDALTQILLAAPRINDLYDVVAPDLAAAFAEQRGRNDTSAARCLWRWATMVGFYLTEPAWVSERDHILDLLARSADDSSAVASEDPTVLEALWTARAPIETPLAENASIAERLADASVHVAARSGIAHASLLRVCRYARITTGAVPAALRDVHHVMLEGYRHWLRDVVATNLEDIQRRQDLSIPDRFIIHFRSSFAPSRTTWRRYRRELHLAARHDSLIRDELRGEVHFTADFLADRLVSLNIAADSAQLLSRASHPFALAMALFFDLGLPVSEIDHRPLAHQVLAAASR